ncbi:hypothetical protein GW17_00007482, partial [Ensete ventricosum]
NPQAMLCQILNMVIRFSQPMSLSLEFYTWETRYCYCSIVVSIYDKYPNLGYAKLRESLSAMLRLLLPDQVLALVIVPVISVAVRQFGRYLRDLSHKTQAAAAVAASIAEVFEFPIQESFGAIRTVRSFAQEDYEISRYSVKVDETLKLGLNQAKLVGLFAGGLNAASTLSVVIVVIYGANLTINGSMTTGALTSFILYSLTGTPGSAFLDKGWSSLHFLTTNYVFECDTPTTQVYLD